MSAVERKERPIIFSGPMVRAILEGRKTQTRRGVKDTGFYAIDENIHGTDVAERERKALASRCPYGEVGDRLWVRETYSIEDGTRDHTGKDPDFIQYQADGCAQALNKDGTATGKFFESDNSVVAKWRPSIFMPRSASRLALEITGIRVERLQDISDDEIIAELGEFRSMSYPRQRKNDFRKLWESINGDNSWAANPWVWVIEFKKVV